MTKNIQENKEFVDSLNKGLKEFFGDVPYTYMFDDANKNPGKIIVGWINGPQKGQVEKVVEDIYKEHGLTLNEFDYKRFFNLKGAEFICKMWNDNFGNKKNGHFDAVGYEEVETPDGFSKDGEKVYVPSFRKEYDGFMNERDRRFWQIALNSVVAVSEPDKPDPKLEALRRKKSDYSISEMLQ